MNIKLYYEDYTYIYHGQFNLESLHKFIQRTITTSHYILHWKDDDDDMITIARNEDLKYCQTYLLNKSNTTLKLIIDLAQLTLERNFTFYPNSHDKDDNSSKSQIISRMHAPNVEAQPDIHVHSPLSAQLHPLMDQVVAKQFNKLYDGLDEFITYQSVDNPMLPQFNNPWEMTLNKSQPIRESVTHVVHINELQQSGQFLMESLSHDTTTNHAYYCDFCSKHISNKVYVCHECIDFHLCGECSVDYNYLQEQHEHQLYEIPGANTQQMDQSVSKVC